MRTVPKVDLLVTTYKRAADLLALMQNLEGQVYDNFQLQIFDGTPDDSVERVVLDYLASRHEPKYLVKFYRTPAGMTRQRNIAVDHTDGDFSIFLDDDVELFPDYLEKVVSLFQRDPHIAALNGFDVNAAKFRKGRKLGKRKSLYRLLGLLPDVGPARYLPWGHGTPHFDYPDRGGFEEVDLLIGHNMAFRTALLKEYRFAEFFEDYPTYVLYDDQDICLRLRKQYKLALSYDARLKHNIAPSGRPPQKHYGFQAFFNAHRNWKLHGGHSVSARVKFWTWEILDMLFQLPSPQTRQMSFGRLKGIWSVIRGIKRYSYFSAEK
jgi:glycosyltransferase involved in cell wall biosynthesis